MQKLWKKNERGTHDYRSEGDVDLVRWNNNSVVTLCSNACGVHLVKPVKRWMKGKSEMISQPNVIARLQTENQSWRNGTGLINAINIISVFSWRLYQLSTSAETKQKDFRRSLVAVVLKPSNIRPRSEAVPLPSFSVPADVITDNCNHYPHSYHVRHCTVCKKNVEFSVKSVISQCIWGIASQNSMKCKGFMYWDMATLILFCISFTSCHFAYKHIDFFLCITLYIFLWMTIMKKSELECRK